MKKITSEEFDELMLHGKGSSSPFYNAIMNMKPGECLTIEKSEWHVKYAPTRIVNKIARKYGFIFESGALHDRSGWAVKRVK